MTHNAEQKISGPLKTVPTYTDLERDLEDAYRTIRALVGHSGESCVSASCPHERAVRKALCRCQTRDVPPPEGCLGCMGTLHV